MGIGASTRGFPKNEPATGAINVLRDSRAAQGVMKVEVVRGDNLPAERRTTLQRFRKSCKGSTQWAMFCGSLIEVMCGDLCARSARFYGHDLLVVPSEGGTDDGAMYFPIPVDTSNVLVINVRSESGVVLATGQVPIVGLLSSESSGNSRKGEIVLVEMDSKNGNLPPLNTSSNCRVSVRLSFSPSKRAEAFLTNATSSQQDVACTSAGVTVPNPPTAEVCVHVPPPPSCQAPPPPVCPAGIMADEAHGEIICEEEKYEIEAGEEEVAQQHQQQLSRDVRHNTLKSLGGGEDVWKGGRRKSVRKNSKTAITTTGTTCSPVSSSSGAQLASTSAAAGTNKRKKQKKNKKKKNDKPPTATPVAALGGLGCF